MKGVRLNTITVGSKQLWVFINFEDYIFILRDCYKWLGLPFDFITTDFWFWCWKFIFRSQSHIA